MSNPIVTISVAGRLNPDAVLEQDLSFHLGAREWYDPDAIEEVCASHPAPNTTFVALKPGHPEFLSGDFYRQNCRFENGLIGLDPANPAQHWHRRTIATINRDLPLMQRDVPHCFDYRDAREADYAALFGTERPIPVFQYHRLRGRKAIIQPLRRYHEYPSPVFPASVDLKPFRAKKPKMFWRGQLHGYAKLDGNRILLDGIAASPRLAESQRVELLRQSLRFRLCEASRGSDVLDAGLAFLGEGRAFRRPLLQALCRNKATPEEQFEYRYLLALDGYDGPSSHYWALNTNSLVLRQESEWEMFGDCYFQPWVHYVPFASDGSDLFEKFAWCERNQPACEEMIENARRAWSILFDVSWQLERRRAVFRRYAEWSGAA